MAENNPIELKSDDGLAKIIAQKGFAPVEEEETKQTTEETKTEGEGQKQENQEGSQTSESTIDINALIAEKTGGKFKSIDELQSIIQEKEEPKKVEIPEFSDDYEKLIWAAAQKGDMSKIKEITNLQRKDIDSMKEKDILMSKLKNELKGLSDEEIEDELFERYGMGLKPLTDEEKELLSEKEILEHNKQMKEFERKRKAEVHTIKEQLKNEINETKNALLEGFKDVFEVKEPAKAVKEEAKVAEQKVEDTYVEPTEEELKFMKAKFETEVKGILPEVSKISIKDKVEISEGVEEDLEINYELSDADQRKLIDYLADYELSPKEEKEFIKVEDGKEVLDLKGLIKAKAQEVFSDKLQKIRDKEIAAKARENVVKKDLKRVDLTPESITDRNTNLSESQSNFMKQWANQIKNV